MNLKSFILTGLLLTATFLLIEGCNRNTPPEKENKTTHQKGDGLRSLYKRLNSQDSSKQVSENSNVEYILKGKTFDPGSFFKDYPGTGGWTISNRFTLLNRFNDNESIVSLLNRDETNLVTKVCYTDTLKIAKNSGQYLAFLFAIIMRQGPCNRGVSGT